MKGKIETVLLVLSLLMLFAFLPTKSNATGTNVYVSPASTNALLGSDCVIYVKVANVTDLYAWEFQLEYDETILDLTSYAVVTGGLNSPTHSFYSNINETIGLVWWAESTIYNTTSGITYSDQAIFELHFHTLATGSSNLHLSGTILSDSAGNEITHTTTDGTVTVYQRDLAITSITVLNYGCSIYKNDIDVNGTSYYYPVEVNVQNTGTFDSGQFHVKLEVYLGASLETSTEILVADLAHGSSFVVNFTNTLRPASTGTYHLVATADSQNEVVEDNESNNTYTSSTFKATIIGDVNGDQKVNILDAVIMAQAWGATPSDPWWNIKGDINHDGTVDIYDATRLSLHWAEFW